ncbi:MAG: hypothetical protein K0U16_07495 [Gammaproteobacteria bacterium]|nr:hypothetical protein [Gammaproteobacteria bacterium]
MTELIEKVGKVFVDALAGAIRAGKDRREAQDIAAEAVRRSDIVSDKLWSDLQQYIEATEDFEENGAG